MPVAAPRPAVPPERRRSVLWSWLLGLPVGILAALAGALLLAVDDLPTVDPGRQVTAADAGRVKALLQAADPRRQPEGSIQRLRLAEADMSLLLGDAARRLAGGAAQVVFQGQAARLEISLPTAALAQRLPLLRPMVWAGDWMNLSTHWSARPEGWPVLDRVQLGRLPLPAAGVRWLVLNMIRWRGFERELALARAAVDQWILEPQSLTVVYRWHQALREQVSATLIPPAEQDRLRAYQQRLAELVQTTDLRADAGIPLVRLLPPMFELARRRTAAQASLPGEAGDSAALTAARENKALVLTLALYAAQQSPARLMPAARDWPMPSAHAVKLRGREDFAQHFLVSAFLAAEGGGRLADAVGVYKEAADARSGSGFSFNDIAADRAGARFGQRLAHDAALVQQQLAGRATPAGADAALRDAELLPEVGDLPEFLGEAEFRARYGKVGSPAYAQVQALIESRIRALPLLQP